MASTVAWCRGDPKLRSLVPYSISICSSLLRKSNILSVYVDANFLSNRFIATAINFSARPVLPSKLFLNRRRPRDQIALRQSDHTEKRQTAYRRSDYGGKHSRCFQVV